MHTVALGQGWRRNEYDALYKKAVEGEATYYEFYFRKAYYLLPRWYGKPGEWERFAEEAAKEAKRCHFKRIGVLGTRYLMEGPVYPEKLKAAGLEHRMPGQNERIRINQIIFDELVNAQFLPRSLAYFTEVIRSLKDEGCDAVALGCTEIPLLVTPDSSPLPTLDSTRLLARAALRKAVGT